MDPWIGQTLLGRYRVEERLGAGGMAAVYLASDLNLQGRRVVVKHPLRESDRVGSGLTDAEQRQRFEREIAGLIALDDIPGIVPILAQGVHEATPYYVMRYMPGGSLAERLERRPEGPGEVAAWALRIGKALDRLHEQKPSVVHRDVKPANILFDRSGEAHLSDFGIVKELTAAWATTARNTGIGTPDYMAPEQLLPDGVVDGRSDQYALAATMYEALTGKPPQYETVERPVGQVQGQAQGQGGAGARGAGGAAQRKRLKPIYARDLAPHVPTDAGQIVARGLARDPAQRHPTCYAMAKAFKAALPLSESSALAERPAVARPAATRRAAPGDGAGLSQRAAPKSAAAPAARTQTPPESAHPRPPRRGLMLLSLLAGLAAFGGWIVWRAGETTRARARENVQQVAQVSDVSEPTATDAPAPSASEGPTAPEAPTLPTQPPAPSTSPVVSPPGEPSPTPEPATQPTPAVEPRALPEAAPQPTPTAPPSGSTEPPTPPESPAPPASPASPAPPAPPDSPVPVEPPAPSEPPTPAAPTPAAPPPQPEAPPPEPAWVGLAREAEAAMAGGDGERVKELMARPEAGQMPMARAKPLSEFVASWDVAPALVVTGPAVNAEIPPLPAVAGGRARWEIAVEGTLRTNRARDRVFVDGVEAVLQGGAFRAQVTRDAAGATSVDVQVRDGDALRARVTLALVLIAPPTPLPVPAWAASLVSPAQRAEAERLRKPVAFEEAKTGMRFVLIPGGTFLMGSPDGEVGRMPDEGPPHEVTLSPFYLAISEVTNAQYRKYVRDHVSGPTKPAPAASAPPPASSAPPPQSPSGPGGPGGPTGRLPSKVRPGSMPGGPSAGPPGGPPGGPPSGPPGGPSSGPLSAPPASAPGGGPGASPTDASSAVQRLEFNRDDQPATMLSFGELQGFAAWLSSGARVTGYRLPSEAQWEYACRAGVTQSRYWGDDPALGARHANANDPLTKQALQLEWAGWPGDDGHRATAPVRSYPPNPWGLFDMLGNVWEWCADWHGPYEATPQPDPVGAPEAAATQAECTYLERGGKEATYRGPARVIRGGGWRSDVSMVRAAKRIAQGPPCAQFLLGGRLALPASAVPSVP